MQLQLSDYPQMVFDKHVYTLRVLLFTAVDVWQCSGGRGGVSPEPLGSVFPPYQCPGNCPRAETTGHCVFLPAQQGH